MEPSEHERSKPGTTKINVVILGLFKDVSADACEAGPVERLDVSSSSISHRYLDHDKPLVLVMVLLAGVITMPLIRSVIRLISSHARWPFVAKGQLLNVSEQTLYRRLCMALPGHRVFSQVSLSQIIQVSDKANFGKWFNRISRKSVDFVICSPGFAILPVIELDVPTHSCANRQHADAVKDRALRSAGVPVIRWSANAIPTEATIRQQIRKLHGPNSAAPASQHYSFDLSSAKG